MVLHDIQHLSLSGQLVVFLPCISHSLAMLLTKFPGGSSRRTVLLGILAVSLLVTLGYSGEYRSPRSS